MALGAQRLLPVLQQIYINWTALKSYSADVKSVYYALESKNHHDVCSLEKLNFNDSIRLINVDFKYSDSDLILNCLNLTILRGQTIGIIGSTGCGKSTLLDILMSLLSPTSGSMYVDDINLTETNNSDFLVPWRNQVAHVPQSIFLADTTIAENIAFSANTNSSVDFNKVVESAKKAVVHDFIASLPNGYDTLVGERGIKLSGGQIQRIGLARALYKDASVLIFDEATSALDNKTEESVMSSLSSLKGNMTIIMVAHRLNTLRSCDRVIKIEGGKIVSDTIPENLPDY